MRKFLHPDLRYKSKPMRVLSIFGTRPEAVKMAPVIQALAAVPQIESKVCVTAQHREMLDQVLGLFKIKPDVDLNLMRPNQSLAELTAEILTHLDPVLAQIQPDWILVQGDTTTVMAASLLGFYRRIHIGHVEAGLRTGDKWQPFPEEIHRRIAGVVADLHFAPTQHSRENLLAEGVPDWRISVTGNTAVDALQAITRMPASAEAQALLEKLDIRPGGRQLILVTAHRRENFGKPLEDICQALRILAETYPERLQIVYPVHLNPNVQGPVHRLLDNIPNITLLSPLDNLPMVHLMKNATLVLTDSGGVQEEATSLKIPALVLRQTTERPEGVTAGVLKLVGTDTGRILAEARNLLDNREAYLAMVNVENPFGDGHAAEKIVKALLEFREQI
jgi:UDP-N-acetylglucosamine 2-epimerase (non-hydrolysing)